MNLVQGLASIYVLVLLVFTLGFLVNWYRNRAVMSSYKRLGFVAALIVVGYELLTLVLSASSLVFLRMSVVSLVLAVGWLMLRIWAFTNNGIFFSNKLGLRSFPLFAPRLGTEITPEIVAEPAPLIAPAINSENVLAAPPIEPGALPVETKPIVTATLTAPVDVPPASAPNLAINWRSYWLTTLGVGLGAVAYSVILFALTLPSVGAVFRDVSVGRSQVTAVGLVLVLEFAFTEEIFFRLGIQNYLATKLVNRRHGYAIAILLTTILWMLGHVGALSPDWVKLVQVFPIGLALGWLYRRNGTESAILAHSLFNFLGPFVINLR